MPSSEPAQDTTPCAHPAARQELVGLWLGADLREHTIYYRCRDCGHGHWEPQEPAWVRQRGKGAA